MPLQEPATSPDGVTDCARLWTMSGVPETRYARSEDGLRIAYQVLGEGPRDIVVGSAGAYCIDAAWDDPAFTATLRRLGRLGRVILLDWRGFGSSDRLPFGALPTPEDWLDDLRVVMDTTGSERAHLIGSQGTAAMLTLFAATYPERAASLTLVDAFARTVRSGDYPSGVPRHVVERFLDWVAEIWGTTEQAAFDAPSRASDRAFLDWAARARRLTNGPTAGVALARWVAELDISAVLPSVQVPALVINSAEHPIARLEHGRYLTERIPGARFVERHGRDEFLISFADGREVLDAIEEFVTGDRQASESDRAFATILFTDVVESTKQLAKLGDYRWRQLLDRHDQIVDIELRRHRGRKVASTGDGVLATFDGPARAVRCAQALVDAMQPLGIELRAGLHAGEVELRAEDIGGIAVHIGQRVSSLAQPGEVLVSRTVTDLVAGSGLQFTDRGEHDLKGVPGTWRLFAAYD